MAGISTEAKVGAFMLAAFAILVFMTMQLGEFKLGGGAVTPSGPSSTT